MTLALLLFDISSTIVFDTILCFKQHVSFDFSEHLHRGGDDVPASEVGGGGSGSAGEAEVGLGLEGIRGRGGGGPQAGKRGEG